MNSFSPRRPLNVNNPALIELMAGVTRVTDIATKRGASARSMDNETNGCGCVEIRNPRPGDIRGIVQVVRTCEPYLTAHMSYIYWKDTRYYRETCAVAELQGEIVGWCSMIPVPGGKYFLHQLGVAPAVRQQGLAGELVGYLLSKLKRQPAFELEFTIDQKNKAALGLLKTVADRAGMRLRKNPEIVQLLEDDCWEELYVMTPLRSKGAECIANEAAA